MPATELTEQVQSALSVDEAEFEERVAEEAEWLTSALQEGTFDNPQAIVGLEYEFYGVDAESHELVRVPRLLLGLIGFEKELGLHNAEMNTSPQPLSRYGLAAQEAEVQARLDAALEQTRAEGIRLVSDALWTIPPTGETARNYLTDSVVDDGVAIATNMSDAVRYHAMANTDYPAGFRLEAPHVTLESDTVMPESLITSIQPHYQVPHAPDLPEHFAYALRVAGPLLALGVNSPFFPPDLYDDVPAEAVLSDALMEHRVGVFESVLNPPGEERGKVTFPRDLESVGEAVERVAGDELIVPMAVEASGRFDDQFAHFRHKHGSYWRWIRPVFGGSSRSAANARIEFRPIAAQPTVRDSVGFLAAFAGLMEHCFRRGHPIFELSWERARDNFYAAARDGLEADLEWITADGERATDAAAIYDDLFAAARDGLVHRGLPHAEADRYLDPLRGRARRGRTPARWKHDGVTRLVEDGSTLEEAIPEVQRAYVDRQTHSLIEGTFDDWPDYRAG